MVWFCLTSLFWQELACDICVVGIGAIPNSEILSEAGPVSLSLSIFFSLPLFLFVSLFLSLSPTNPLSLSHTHTHTLSVSVSRTHTQPLSLPLSPSPHAWWESDRSQTRRFCVRKVLSLSLTKSLYLFPLFPLSLTHIHSLSFTHTDTHTHSLSVSLHLRGRYRVEQDIQGQFLALAKSLQPFEYCSFPLAGVKVDARGAILVDEHLRTSAKEVWAVNPAP